MRVPEAEDPGYAEFRNYATQYASAISNYAIDDGQWVGRLIRVYGELFAPNGARFGGMGAGTLPEEIDRDAALKFKALQDFLSAEKITDLEIGEVTYEPDPNDTTGLYHIARGYIDIKASEGKTFEAGKRYSFEHSIKKTYHSRKSIFREVGPIPVPEEPVIEKPVNG